MIWFLLALLTGDPTTKPVPPKLDHLPAKVTRDLGELTVEVAKSFLGKPYEGKTLDQSEEESLVYHFDRFDCFTLVVTSLALAQGVQSKTPSPQAFEQALTKLRYRDGKLEGYPSRLHYFTDWAYDNARQGLVTDITAQIGGKPWPKTIDFMSNHRNAYRQLADDKNYTAIQQVERNLNKHKRHYIPKAEIAAVEHLIQDGDILALTTGIKGLDIVHTGIAVKGKDGRLHMLHASTTSNQVEITAKPLADYTTGIKSQNGLMVFRPTNQNTGESK